MDWTITPQAPEATRTDTARIRNAFDALADRGVDTMAAQDVLHPLIDRIAEERNGATYRDLAPATDPTTAPLADPTAPDTAETTAIHRCVAQAVNVYNSRRPAFTIFDAVATESGIKSINRAVWLRGVRAGTEPEARLAWVHVDKHKRPGRTQRHAYIVAAPLFIGTTVRALSVILIDTQKGLRIDAFNPIL